MRYPINKANFVRVAYPHNHEAKTGTDQTSEPTERKDDPKLIVGHWSKYRRPDDGEKYTKSHYESEKTYGEMCRIKVATNIHQLNITNLKVFGKPSDFCHQKSLKEQFNLINHKIKSVKTLQIDFGACRLTEKHCKEFYEFLVANRNMEKITLKLDLPELLNITYEPTTGVKVIFEALKKLDKTKELTISLANTFGFFKRDQAFACLGDALAHLPNIKNLSIDIRDNSCPDDELRKLLYGASRISKLEHFSLNISCSDGLTSRGSDELMNFLGKLKSVKTLNFDISSNPVILPSGLISALSALEKNGLLKLRINTTGCVNLSKDPEMPEKLKEILEKIKTRGNQTKDKS